ncbi:MAG: C45 family autoproteolytic acyltransferase/hydrolase [Bdellovibrionota bacterium]
MRTMILSLFFLSLTQSAFAEPCKSLVDEPGASIFDCGGVHVVHLSGKPADRARQFGGLVRSGKLSNEVLHYFTDKVSDLAHEEAGWLSYPLRLVYNQLVRLFHRGTPRPLSEEIDAMAGGLGIDPIVLRRGLSLPDTGVFIQGLGSEPLLHFLPATGCTSVAARLPDGGFAYGRNLDFAGVGTWDKHPMLLSIEPEPGSKELRHLVIAADGMPFGGITGVNEAGLTFAVHQNYSRDISLHGVPMVLIGELLLRGAKTLDEALEILKQNRPANLWTFVITDLKTGETMAVESSSRVFLVRHGEGKYFAQTNHNMHSESRARENSSFGVEANSIFRMDQAFRMMEAAPPQGAGALAKILAYQEDPLGQLSGYHDVMKSETIQTVLFESHPGLDPILAVSAEEAPTSGGRFATFTLSQFWKNETPHWDPRDYVQTPADKRHRQRTIAAAYALYFDQRKPVEAASLLASQKTFDAALFRCVAMANADRYSDSLRIAEEALRDPRFTGEPQYIRESFDRVRLISFLHLHRNDEARAFAQSVVEGKERGQAGPSKQKLLELSQRVLNRDSIPHWMLALHFDFFSGDLSGRKD